MLCQLLPTEIVSTEPHLPLEEKSWVVADEEAPARDEGEEATEEDVEDEDFDDEFDDDFEDELDDEFSDEDSEFDETLETESDGAGAFEEEPEDDF